MKAIILAGGRGERLRPLTEDMPKPLVPILNRPVMDYTLSLISHYGIKRATVTTCFLADKIKEHYGEGKFGVRLDYVQETVPLGTAGGVKKCFESFKDEDDFLVISGDAICDFDLQSAIQFHKEKKAVATVILSSVSKPLEYGVVISDGDGRINALAEKPDWSEALSDLVNTGVYIFSREIFSMIPDGEKYDFAKDLFPKLISEKKRIYGFKDGGYWCDIGKIPEYYRCNLDLLNDRFVSHASLSGTVNKTGNGKYFVSDTAFVSEDAVINENTVISDNVRIEKGANVSGSIIMKDSRIGENAKVFDSILGENTTVSENAFVSGEAVIGKGGVIGKGAAVSGGKYPPDSHFEAKSAFSSSDEFSFTEDGVKKNSCFLNEEECEKLGYSFGSVFGEKIIVMYDREKPESEYFASVFSLGILKSGQNVLNAGKGDMSMTSFLSHRFNLPSCYVTEVQGKAKITGFEKDSMSLLRETALKLAKFRNDKKEEKLGKPEEISDAERLYIDALSDEMEKGSGRVFGFFGTKRAELLQGAAIKKGFNSYNEKVGEMCSFSVHGDELEVFLGNERIFNTHRARLFVINQMISEGRKTFYFPDSAPQIFVDTVIQAGGEVKKYSTLATVKDETEIRLSAAKERWLFDSCFLGAKVIKYISKYKNTSLRNIFEKVPMFYVSTLTFFPHDDTRLRLVCRAIEEIDIDNVRIVPLSHTIKIISEASSFEAALDNAFEYRGKLNEIEQKIKGR